MCSDLGHLRSLGPAALLGGREAANPVSFLSGVLEIPIRHLRQVVIYGDGAQTALDGLQATVRALERQLFKPTSIRGLLPPK